MKYLQLLIIISLLHHSYSYIRTSRKFSTIKSFKSKLLLNIPDDISYDDSILTNNNLDIPILLPNTEIQSFDGAFNLGVIIWTYVLYNGLFTSKYIPGEWTLPLLAKITNQTNEQWFKDFNEFYLYEVPYYIDILRATIFICLAVFVNQLIINSFDGDIYWGWATAGSLLIPSALVTVARDKKPTREYASLENQLKQDFDEYANDYINRNKYSKCNESRLILGFNQKYQSKYNDLNEKQQTAQEKILKKLIRKWVGYKANIDGNYLYIELKEKKIENVITNDNNINNELISK